MGTHLDLDDLVPGHPEASEELKRLRVTKKRYETLRRMTSQQFEVVLDYNLRTGKLFEDIIDELETILPRGGTVDMEEKSNIDKVLKDYKLVDKPFWIVWNVSHQPESTPTVMHTSEEGAIKEAERLARRHRYATFVVFRSVCSRRTDDMFYINYE